MARKSKRYVKDKIEALEYCYELLEAPIHEERRAKVLQMIEAYKAEEEKRKEVATSKTQILRVKYVPPGL